MPRLDFSHVYSYPSNDVGISLPVVLRSGGEIIDFRAYVDTGASFCLFERKYGELLNLDVEAGESKIFWTATGQVNTFGHMVDLEVLGLQVESIVYFFADDQINKNLLGRTGWLDRVRLGLIEYDWQLYLAPYDFEPESKR